MQCQGRGLTIQFCTHVLPDDLDRIAMLCIDKEKGRSPVSSSGRVQPASVTDGFGITRNSTARV